MYTIFQKTIYNHYIYEYKVYAPDVAKRCQAGQFIIAIPIEDSERIPLTIVDFDRALGWVSIIFQVVGRSTQELAFLKVGDQLKAFVGPLGLASQLKSDKRVLCIGGGVGIAPLYPQIKQLKVLNSEVDVIIGAKNQDNLLLTRQVKAICNHLYICTDDGSVGFKGFVTDILNQLVAERKKYDEVIVIGPVVMMKAVVNLTKLWGIPTMVSLNPIMIDGTGMCGCCRVSVGGEQKFACVDGPDFDGFQVDFDALIERQRFFRTQEQQKQLEMTKFLEKRQACSCLDAAINNAEDLVLLSNSCLSEDVIGLNQFVFGVLSDGGQRAEPLKYDTCNNGLVKEIFSIKATH